MSDVPAKGDGAAMTFSAQVGSFRKGNPAPLYLQLQQLLRDAITNNVLAEDDAIPAERDLAIEYDVSRITVRKPTLRRAWIGQDWISRTAARGSRWAQAVRKSCRSTGS